MPKSLLTCPDAGLVLHNFMLFFLSETKTKDIVQLGCWIYWHKWMFQEYFIITRVLLLFYCSKLCEARTNSHVWFVSSKAQQYNPLSANIIRIILDETWIIWILFDPAIANFFRWIASISTYALKGCKYKAKLSIPTFFVWSFGVSLPIPIICSKL